MRYRVKVSSHRWSKKRRWEWTCPACPEPHDPASLTLARAQREAARHAADCEALHRANARTTGRRQAGQADHSLNGGPMTTDLHALLNSLTHGEHVKATWTQGTHQTTVEGPLSINGRYCSCDRTIRWGDGDINSTLISFEVTRTEDVTVTRDDEDALHALLDSLEEGETVTAEWRSEAGTMTITGPVQTSRYFRGVVRGGTLAVLRWYGSDDLPETLYSVTARRTVTQRWEREGDE